MEPEYRCIVCGGPLIFLGTLGNFDHYRCRNCGSDSPKVAEKPATADSYVADLIASAAEASEMGIVTEENEDEIREKYGPK